MFINRCYSIIFKLISCVIKIPLSPLEIDYFEAIIIRVFNENKYEVCETIKILCKSIDILCYELDDWDTPLLSLTWIETIQYMDDECLDDFECSENVLKSFGYTLDIVINHQYEFLLDLNSIAKKLKRYLNY